MPTVVLKLIAGQDTGWTDGQSGDYMLLWSVLVGCNRRFVDDI